MKLHFCDRYNFTAKIQIKFKKNNTMATKKEIVSIIGVTVVFLAIIAISVVAIVKTRQDILEAQQPKVYQIDTTKVQVLYEDTWGKILFVKEEDL